MSVGRGGPGPASGAGPVAALRSRAARLPVAGGARRAAPRRSRSGAGSCWQVRAYAGSGSRCGVRGWMVTGYDEARSVLADAETFSNDFGHMVGRPGIGRELDPGGLGLSDPPYHTELRRLLAPEFTPRRLASRLPTRCRPSSTNSSTSSTARPTATGSVDLVAHFARPVPWQVICDLLGIREDGSRAARRPQPPAGSTSTAAWSVPLPPSAAGTSTCGTSSPGPGPTRSRDSSPGSSSRRG